MKLKSKVLLALILGVSSCMTLGVSAFGGDDDSSSSESGSHGCCTPYDSDTDSFPSVPHSGSCTPISGPSSPLLGFYELPSSARGILGDALSDATAPAAGDAAHCASFSDLIERLRNRQKINGWRQVDRSYDCESHVEDFSEYVYWINTKLPTASINLYNKWFGDDLQSGETKDGMGTVAVLPTSYKMRGRSYNRAELENIILDESNWEPHRGMQSTNRGVCTESGAKCPTFDSYVRYLRAQGITVRD